MKSKKSAKKYTYEHNINQSSSHLHELQEQLRKTLQLLQQHKLSSQLEHQKRILIEHQFHQLKQENLQLRGQIEKVKKDLNKLSKKYMKNKQLKQCEKCKKQEQYVREVQREREIFIKQRTVLKNQIKQLKKNMEMMDDQSEVGKLQSIIDKLKKQINFKKKTIDEQNKVIRFLDEKLSTFELQNMKILSSVQSVDQRLQELQMQNNILKGFSDKQYQHNTRINGSIKNFERQDKSKSRLSRDSY